ncbi:MAG TPA: alpha/beta hydrolase [Azospirillaceae bacterium]|nr:alpha/beta hydrolase [Azospirillaceae bacterium]
MGSPYNLKRGNATIAYVATPGRSPGVLFLGGFKSDMTGAKATALEAFCRRTGRAFVRFDYQGHGASGGRFEDGTLSVWRDDALAVLDEVAAGPQVLVGSSMGGWIAVLAALARPGRVAGLVGVAAAPDFTEDLLWARLDADARARMLRDGFWRTPSAYSAAPYVYTHALVEDGRRNLVLRGPVPFRGPVRLLHGTADPDVPWQQSLRLLERLEGADARLTLVKDGDHRLSRPQDLDLLCRTVAEVAGLAEGAPPAGVSGGP